MSDVKDATNDLPRTPPEAINNLEKAKPEEGHSDNPPPIRHVHGTAVGDFREVMLGCFTNTQLPLSGFWLSLVSYRAYYFML